MPFCSCYRRVGRLPDPDLCCFCVGRSSPGQPSRLHPDLALSHRHATPPAAVNAGHFHPMPTAARRPAAAGYPLACQPSRYPPARPGMTHRDEQSMRRRIKSTHIAHSAHRGSLSASNAWTYRTSSSACERATSLLQDRRPDPRPQRPERMPVVWTSDNASRSRAVLCRREQQEGRGPDRQVSPRRLAARIGGLTQQPLQHKTRLSSEHLRYVHPMPTRCLACFRRPYGRHRLLRGWLLLLAVGSGRLWLLWWETDY